MDLRALVVCPEKDSASLLTHILSELGMEAEHTPSITRGLELLDSQRYDAVILDYRADPSSEEFLAHLRRSAQYRACLLIAVVDGEFNARPVFGLGANFVLYRPLSSERTRISLRAARGLMRRERRRTPRTSVSLTANVGLPGAPELGAVLTSLSAGGTALQTAKFLPSSCKVYFEFALPGERNLVRLSGEVAWQDSSGRTGIRFLNVPQASRRVMDTWLQRNSRRTSAAPSAPLLASNSCAEPAPPRATHSATGADPGPVSLVSNAGNRRKQPRYACKVGAEVHDVSNNVPNHCQLSDISEGGCYVEMPSPISGKSGVEILIRTADTKFRIMGQVLATHPGFGMGVRFTFRDFQEREEILRLIAVLSGGASLDQQLQ